MKVPFGSTLPNDNEKELLTKLGFNLENLENSYNIYYLNIPDSRRIRCIKSDPDLDHTEYEIYYNDINVIAISRKTSVDEPYLYFFIDRLAVAQALAKNSEIPYESLPERVEVPPSAHQQEIIRSIAELQYMLGRGLDLGCNSKHIGTKLKELKHLYLDKPEEYDALLETNPGYKKFVNSIFPSIRTLIFAGCINRNEFLNSYLEEKDQELSEPDDAPSFRP